MAVVGGGRSFRGATHGSCDYIGCRSLVQVVEVAIGHLLDRLFDLGSGLLARLVVDTIDLDREDSLGLAMLSDDVEGSRDIQPLGFQADLVDGAQGTQLELFRF